MLFAMSDSGRFLGSTVFTCVAFVAAVPISSFLLVFEISSTLESDDEDEDDEDEELEDDDEVLELLLEEEPIDIASSS